MPAQPVVEEWEQRSGHAHATRGFHSGGRFVGGTAYLVVLGHEVLGWWEGVGLIVGMAADAGGRGRGGSLF
jgi:hypothetical protein